MKLNILFVFLSVFISLNSYAFKFSPMSTSIETKSGNNSTLFYLENDSDQPIAVTVSVLTREMNAEGVETNNKIDGEMTVYPSQLIIPGNEKRSAKVTWVGKTVPTKELAYRLVAEQLPIDLDKEVKKKAAIKVLLRCVAALYIAPESYNSDVTLKKFEVTSKNVSFRMQNAGKKHQILAGLVVKISGKKELEFSGEELKGMSGENILALSERVFTFPKTGKFSDVQQSDKVKINFDKD